MDKRRLHAKANSPQMWKVLTFPTADRYLRDIDMNPLSLAELRDAARRYAISPSALSSSERDAFLDVVGRIVPTSPETHAVFCWTELVFSPWLAGRITDPPLSEPKVIWLRGRVEDMMHEATVANSMLDSIEEPSVIESDYTYVSPGTTLWAIYELSLFKALWREFFEELNGDELSRLAEWASRHAGGRLEPPVEPG